MVRLLALLMCTAGCAARSPDGGAPAADEAEAPSFVDVAAQSGLTACAEQSALAVGDLDGDGFDDVYQGCGAEPARLFLHGAGGMIDGSMRLPLRSEAAYADRQVPALGDYDGDGDLDVAIPAGGGGGVDCCGAQQVFENVGPAWLDRAEALGLADNARRGRVALWTDSDLDGSLELVVASAFGPDADPESARLRMWKQGEAGWEDHAAAWKADEPDHTGAMLAIDLDHDNAAELILSSRLGVEGDEPLQPLRVLVPKFGDGGRYARLTCTGVKDVVTVAAGDFNHDGQPDLAIGRLGAPAELWRNPANGDSPCNWPRTGLGDDTIDATALVAADLDNDGALDLLVATSGYEVVVDADREAASAGPVGRAPLLLRGNDDGTFESSPLDLAYAGRPMATWGDLDHDGSVEVLLGTDASAGAASLAVLDAPSVGNGVVIRLRDEGSGNTWGLGARVRVVSEAQSWQRWVQTGGGWRAALPPQVHVGVGDATWVDVVVEWFNGDDTTVLGLETGRCWEIGSDGVAVSCG